MRRRASVAVGTAVSLALLTAACTDAASTPRGSDSRPAATSTSTSTPSPDPTDRARSAVLTAYRAYWAAQVKAHAVPDGNAVAELSKYSVDQALADVQATVLLFRQRGIVVRGQPVLRPTVTSVSLTGTPSAAITDCVDSTHWTPVFKATGKSALAPGQAARVVMESTAIVYDGHWAIRTSVAQRSRTC